MKGACLSGLLLGSAILHAAQPLHPNPPGIAPTQSFTFAVFGDNRGDESGEQPPSFFQVLQAINNRNPAFVLDTGDMVYGHTRDEAQLREQWRIYLVAARRLRAPLFHVPGNHDIWNDWSARVYRELWGTNYYSFDCGNARFIGLDTESVSCRIDQKQFTWLEQQLRDCKLPNVFVFFHRPPFPIDGGIGSSLDAFLLERNRLHELFVRYRGLIRAVFAGHEHLYNYQKRDGVAYYTTGGGGASLYTAPELGGVHHFLMVQVSGQNVNISVEKVSAPMALIAKPRPIAPGELLESWNSGLFWYARDRSACVELTSSIASQGQRALRLNFDPVQYAWPVLVLSLPSRRDFSGCSSLSLDVYCPDEQTEGHQLTTALQCIAKHEAAPVTLRHGWNTVTTTLNGAWLPLSERQHVEAMEWSLSAQNDRSPGYLVFDNLRVSRQAAAGGETTELLESWERPLLWRVFDETVLAEVRPGGNPHEKQGLVLHLDFSRCNRPVLFARLNPPWDLSQVQALQLNLIASENVPNDLSFRMVLRTAETTFEAPPRSLRPGVNQLNLALDESWLLTAAKSAVEQVAFYMASANTTRQSDLLFQNLSSAPDR
jgi:3',5'-cyclic AMP phosphodiesterase CpdA